MSDNSSLCGSISRKPSLKILVHKQRSSSKSGEGRLDEDERHRRELCTGSPSRVEKQTRSSPSEDGNEQHTRCTSGSELSETAADDDTTPQTREEQDWGFTPRTTDPRSSRGLRRTLNKLRQHPRVESLLDYFITVSANGSSDVNVGITREHFLNLYIRCYKATMPDIDVGLAEKMACTQWNHGGFRSSKTISRPEFMNKLFELINNCTHTLDVKEYVLFASLLFEKIIQTVKHGDTLQHRWRDMADISVLREEEHFSFEHDPERFTPFPHPNTANFQGFKETSSMQTCVSAFAETTTRVKHNSNRKSDTTEQLAKRKRDSGNTNPKSVSTPSVQRGFMKMTESRKLRHRNPASTRPTNSSATKNRQKSQRSQPSSAAPSTQQTPLLHGSYEPEKKSEAIKKSSDAGCCLEVKKQNVPAQHSSENEVSSCSNQGTRRENSVATNVEVLAMVATDVSGISETEPILPQELAPPTRRKPPRNTGTMRLNEGKSLIADGHDRSQQKVDAESHSQKEANTLMEKPSLKTERYVVSDKDQENTKDTVLEQSNSESNAELQAVDLRSEFKELTQKSFVIVLNSDKQQDKVTATGAKRVNVGKKYTKVFMRKKHSRANRLDRNEQESVASCEKISKTRSLKQEPTSKSVGDDEPTNRNVLKTSMYISEKTNANDFDPRRNSCTIAVSLKSESWNPNLLSVELPQAQNSIIDKHQYRDCSSDKIQPVLSTPDLNWKEPHEGFPSTNVGDCKTQSSAREQTVAQGIKLQTKKKAGSRKDKDSKRKGGKEKERHYKERTTSGAPSTIEASDKTREVDTGEYVSLSPEKDEEEKAELTTSRTRKTKKNSSKRVLSKNKPKKGVRLRPKTRPHCSNRARKTVTAQTHSTFAEAKEGDLDDSDTSHRGLKMITIRRKDQRGETAANASEIPASISSQPPSSISSINWVMLNRKLSGNRNQSPGRELTWRRLMPRCLTDVPLLALERLSQIAGKDAETFF